VSCHRTKEAGRRPCFVIAIVLNERAAPRFQHNMASIHIRIGWDW
jgi:hypothetical protein